MTIQLVPCSYALRLVSAAIILRNIALSVYKVTNTKIGSNVFRAMNDISRSETPMRLTAVSSNSSVFHSVTVGAVVWVLP